MYKRQVFHRPGGPARWAKAKLVRYADDFVVLARFIDHRITGWIEATVEGWLGLTINRDKTRVIHLRTPGHSLDFLGYTFRYDRDLRGRPWTYLNWGPSKKALARERQALRERTAPRHSHVPVTDLIVGLNRHLRGWANYFSLGYPRKAVRQIDSYARERIYRHLRRRSQRPYRPPKGVTHYDHLHRLGLIRL